jgi:hypothetical protein
MCLHSLKRITLLCHLTSIYRLLDGQPGARGSHAVDWQATTVQTSGQSITLFEHPKHIVGERYYVTSYARLRRENCSPPERAYDYSALHGETPHNEGSIDPRSISMLAGSRA